MKKELHPAGGRIAIEGVWGATSTWSTSYCNEGLGFSVGSVAFWDRVLPTFG